MCTADCFAFTVCQEGEMFCQANQSLIFLNFVPFARMSLQISGVASDFLVLHLVLSDLIITLTRLYVQQGFKYVHLFSNLLKNTTCIRWLLLAPTARR